MTLELDISGHYKYPKIKEEDIPYFEELIENEYSKILDKGTFSRLNFWKIFLTLILLMFWIIPGVLYLAYVLLSKKHAKAIAKRKASLIFYDTKMRIPTYSTTEGINLIQNLGHFNTEGKGKDDCLYEAFLEAYNMNAKALINIRYDKSSHSETSSYYNGIGAKRGIETKTFYSYALSCDFALVEK